MDQLLAKWGFTRDDGVWFWGKWAAVATSLATMGTDVTQFGVPGSVVPYIKLAALILGIFSAQQATSGLPGKPAGGQ